MLKEFEREEVTCLECSFGFTIWYIFNWSPVLSGTVTWRCPCNEFQSFDLMSKPVYFLFRSTLDDSQSVSLSLGRPIRPTVRPSLNCLNVKTLRTARYFLVVLTLNCQKLFVFDPIFSHFLLLLSITPSGWETLIIAA